MGLESGTYINSLVPSNPTGADPRAQGDDHIRLIKSTIKNTFPNVNGIVSVTDEQLNTIPALTTGKADITYVDSENDAQNVAVTAELALKAPIASPALTGVPTAPTAAVDTATSQLATTAFVQSAITGYFTGDDQLITSDGYQKFPGGLILQWGYSTTNPVEFPIPFPTACLRVIPQHQSNTSGANSSFNYVATMTTTGFTRGNPAGACVYLAIGN